MDEYPLFINLQYALTAFSDYPGNALDRLVFTDIAQFANRYGVSYTTTRSIAKRIGRCREAVSKSVNRIAKKMSGFYITKEKKGQDKHPRNVYHIPQWCLRRRPDKRSKHYNAAAWKRWCEIGRKRAITIKLKQKKTGTIREAAAKMASRLIAARASTTPAQARDARQARGGGFDGFGGALAGLFPTASAAPTTTAAVKDDFSQQVPRGGWSQALREHEAAAAMDSQTTQTAAPTTTAPAVPPIRTEQEKRDGMAQANEELQQLRERLRQQAAAPTTQDTTAARMAARDVARGYSRASKRAAYPSGPWLSSTAETEPVQQPQTTADMQQEARAAWLAGLQATKWQAARDARQMARASQRAAYPAITR